jgi:hypothetical protein
VKVAIVCGIVEIISVVRPINKQLDAACSFFFIIA